MKAKTRKEIIKWKMIHYDTDILYDYDWEPDHFRDKEAVLHGETINDPTYKYHGSELDFVQGGGDAFNEKEKYAGRKYEDAYFFIKGKYFRSRRNWLVDFPTKEYVINLLKIAYAESYWTRWVNEEVIPLIDEAYNSLTLDEQPYYSLGDLKWDCRNWYKKWAVKDERGRIEEEKKMRQTVSDWYKNGVGLTIKVNPEKEEKLRQAIPKWKVEIGSFPEYRELDMEEIKRDLLEGYLVISDPQVEALEDPELSEIAINVNARKRLAHWMCCYWYDIMQPRIYDYCETFSDDWDNDYHPGRDIRDELMSLFKWKWYSWAGADKKGKETIERELIEKLSNHGVAKYLDLTKPQLFMPTEKQIIKSDIIRRAFESYSLEKYTEEAKKQLIEDLKEVNK